MDTEEVEKSDASMLDTMLGVLLKVCPPNIVEAAATMNVLGVLTFSLFFGVILARLPGETGQPLIQGVQIFNQVVMGMVMAILVFDFTPTPLFRPFFLAIPPSLLNFILVSRATRSSRQKSPGKEPCDTRKRPTTPCLALKCACIWPSSRPVKCLAVAFACRHSMPYRRQHGPVSG